MTTPQFSAAELERMRTILAQADSIKAKESNNFDLNNPPRKPYRHQEFPRMMYHHDSGSHKTVADAEQLEDALDTGWSMDPFPIDNDDAPELSAADAAEAAAKDEQIKEARRKKREEAAARRHQAE